LTIHVGVVTAARSDYGLLVPLVSALFDDPDFELTLYATGMHFSPRHGETINEIRSEPWCSTLVEIPSAPKDDSSEAAAQALAAGIEGFAHSYATQPPDLIVVMGDRLDVMACVIAALPFDLPIAHISGGELSQGVVDDRIRHAITKMSHIHFTAHPDFARRVIQLGEAPDRVVVAGEPGLDLLAELATEDKETVFAAYDLDLEAPVSVFTFHPIGPDPDVNRNAMEIILQAADRAETQIVFTYPNADPGSSPIIDAIEAYCAGHENCSAWPSLGRYRYINLANHADCIVGNSSSGLVEAASFQLPVVNIGDRQAGRIAPANVLSVRLDEDAIAQAWEKALSGSFRHSLAGLKNPYGDGNAVSRILDTLRTMPRGADAVSKVFYDIDGPYISGS
jgi:UDP-hydrolysing UDP-N-acetyl-D-glucosamine 2-epimerase